MECRKSQNRPRGSLLDYIKIEMKKKFRPYKNYFTNVKNVYNKYQEVVKYLIE